MRPRTVTNNDILATEQLLAKLVAHFSFHPSLEWSNDAQRSRAFYRRDLGGGHGMMRLSLRTWRGAREALLHEYAHIVLFNTTGGHGHGDEFYRAVRRVIAAVGVTDYRWHEEYQTIWQMAVRDGLTTKAFRADSVPAQWVSDQPASTPASSTTSVRVGMAVSWQSPSRGVLRGVVVSAQRGCRARIKAGDGTQWMVPTAWLKAEARPLGASYEL